MRTFSLVVVACLLLIACRVSRSDKDFAVIPFPVSVKSSGGFFSLAKETTISDPQSKFPTEAQAFNSYLEKSIGTKLHVTGSPLSTNTITLNLDTAFAPEAYELTVSTDKISITGSRAGVYY